MGVGSEADLLEIIAATHPGRGFADLLHCGEQKPDQDRNDRDHDQEFNQGKGMTTNAVANHEGSPGTWATRLC
jgi:hypothetical protein